MKHRVLAELRALGPRPSWWRPFKRRRWNQTAKALCALYVALVLEEQVRAMHLAQVFASEVEKLGKVPVFN